MLNLIAIDLQQYKMFKITRASFFRTQRADYMADKLYYSIFL